MNGTAAIRTALKSSQHLLTWFLSDLSDADLLVRPAPGANHIAWQVGHLILAEPQLVGMIPATVRHGATFPELPAGFAAAHAQERTAAEGADGFLTRAEYVDLFNKVRGATLAAVEGLTDADLDAATEGRMAAFAPTVGALLLLVSNHTLMHAGQFSVVRRKLGKPVLF